MAADHGRRSLAALLRIYNLAAVARELRVDPSTLYRWRDGRAKPTAERLQDLARLLRIDANDILFGEDDVTSDIENVLLTNPRVQREHEIYIRADKDARYGVVARAVAAARAAGVTSLNLLVDPEVTKP